MISGVCIKEAESGATYGGIDDLVGSRQREIILGAGFVEPGVIDAHVPLAIFLLDEH